MADNNEDGDNFYNNYGYDNNNDKNNNNDNDNDNEKDKDNDNDKNEDNDNGNDNNNNNNNNNDNEQRMDDFFYYATEQNNYYDDYYSYVDDNTFIEYEVTSVNPGYRLLFITVGYAALCLFIGFLCKYCCRGKKKKQICGVGGGTRGGCYRRKKIIPDQQEGPPKSRIGSIVSIPEERSRSNTGSGSSDSDGDDLSKALHVKPAELGEETSPSDDQGREDKIDFLKSNSSFGGNVMDPSIRNAIGIGLFNLDELDDFGSIFVDRTSRSRRWRNCKACAGMSRHRSLGSRSNRSTHSISTMGDSFTMFPQGSKKMRNSVNLEQKSVGLDAAAASSSYQQLVDNESMTDKRTTEEQVTFESEVKDMLKLAIPWAFSSFVVSTASIITIGIISHYIGTAEMICYGYVWFFMGVAHIMSNALYSSLYKHANNAKALGTQEGYDTAGKYVRISIILDFIISIPISIILIFTVGPIMRLYGYGNRIANLSQKYTLLASLSNFINTSTGYASIIPDLEGRAYFDAIYGLVDASVEIAIALFLIPVVRPSLLGFGLIQIIQDLVSINVYYIITGFWNGWFNKYLNGMFGPLDFKAHHSHILGPYQFEGKDANLVQSLVRKAIPMTFDVFTGEIEWFVLTIFAAYLGPAEAAALVLISYIWSFVGIIPTNLASAFEYRISNLLSNDNLVLAKRMAFTSIWITTVVSALSCAILYLSRNLIVDGMTKDENLHDMLMEIIPYIILCDPLIAPSTAASYLNRALVMYKRSAKVEFLVTLLVTLPVAAVSTYMMGYNIEGIFAALYAGYATMGVVIFYVYFNADWDRSVVKNKKMSGDYSSDDEEISRVESTTSEKHVWR